ncbi:CENPS protein, partial [Columbina picui]|nr:CENPS protein [Columbina picui]
QRLKTEVHSAVVRLCEEVAEEKDVQFHHLTIATITEITFKQCGTQVCILSHFYVLCRHAKRSTITTKDVELLARRSNSLLKHITQKSEELASSHTEQKKKKKKFSAAEGGRTSGEHEAAAIESEDSDVA